MRLSRALSDADPEQIAAADDRDRAVGAAAPATAGDCPECQSAGTVRDGACQICFAEPDEGGAAGAGRGAPPALRFADVIAELASMASPDHAGSATDVASAAARARILLLALRTQFVDEVILGPSGIDPRS